MLPRESTWISENSSTAMICSKSACIYAFFSISKSIFFGFYKMKNQTGTTVGKPRKFYTFVRGVDFLFSRAKNLHRALKIKTAWFKLGLKPKRFGSNWDIQLRWLKLVRVAVVRFFRGTVYTEVRLGVRNLRVKSSVSLMRQYALFASLCSTLTHYA